MQLLKSHFFTSFVTNCDAYTNIVVSLGGISYTIKDDIFNFFQPVSKHRLKEVKASGGCHGFGSSLLERRSFAERK